MKRLIILFALAACSTPVPPLPAQSDDTCGAARYASLIGQSAEVLETTLLLGMVRVIRPGDMVTRDYRIERINFMIDANETIEAINCG